MDTQMLVTAFATLFVIIDPIGLTPLFLALTPGASRAERRAIAVRACLLAVGVLTLFAFFGEAVLGFVGISMPAFRIAGGILLFLTALDMLFERRSKRREDRVEELPDPSVFPLGIPLIAGPGAIASVILLTGGAQGELIGTLAVVGVMVAVIGLVFIFFLGSGVLEHVLGKIGINVVTRLLGMLLAALSVQFVVDGLSDLSLIGA